MARKLKGVTVEEVDTDAIAITNHGTQPVYVVSSPSSRTLVPKATGHPILPGTSQILQTGGKKIVLRRR